MYVRTTRIRRKVHKTRRDTVKTKRVSTLGLQLPKIGGGFRPQRRGNSTREGNKRGGGPLLAKSKIGKLDFRPRADVSRPFAAKSPSDTRMVHVAHNTCIATRASFQPACFMPMTSTCYFRFRGNALRNERDHTRRSASQSPVQKTEAALSHTRRSADT